NSFDGGQQRIAYWQALQTVEYMVRFYGEDSLRAVLAELKKGTRMNQAVGQALEVDFDAFAADCRQYIEQQIIEVGK
ncbi:MAG: hypothetical protein Q4B48_01125, partial [Syntrophomonadaceae bacterium]|nr:hypothetical protein [Syntrophomonadaceae bacterium]